MNKKILSCAIVGLTVLSGQASGQAPFVPSEGEAGPVLACFYECNLGPGTSTTTWQEVTALLLTNQSPNDSLASMTILNGHENAIARTSTVLSPLDVDEINVCRTLQSAGITPPSAGVVQIEVTDTNGATPALGTFAWIKNLVGKFFITVNDPFQGLVNGVAKTECRIVPSTLATVPPGAPSLPPVYIQNTGE